MVFLLLCIAWNVEISDSVEKDPAFPVNPRDFIHDGACGSRHESSETGSRADCDALAGRQYMKILMKVAFSEILRVVLFPLRILRIKSNRILFTGLTGGTSNEYSCNPMYLCEYLLKHEPEKYEIIWAVSDPEEYEWLKEKGIRLVKHFSLSSFPWLLTARVIVSNGSYAPWFPFRQEQYFINTWHGGGAYKKIENDRPDAGWAARKRAKFCADNISLFVSSCKMASRKLMRGTFGYQGEIMEVGMPRNDFLVKGDLGESVRKVRECYHIPEQEKILLYAPTYRHGETPVILQADHLLKKLEEKGEKWNFLYRAHRYQDSGMKLAVEGDRVVNASMYPDMQELLAAADCLITDYSSNIWDYSFLYRPCFLYTPDLEEYLETTGFYVGIRQWPFPAAQTQEELYRFIEEYDPQTNRMKIDRHHKMMGNAETGEACALVASRIAEVCEE